MVRLVDRVEKTHMKACRTGESSRWPHATYGPGGRTTDELLEDKPPRVSLARRLEGDERLGARVARWLLLKGGMAVVLLAGLILLGLIGVFR
jgi:hypothetical protein